MTGSYEVGLEMKFLNGRLSLDATYYNQNSKDQILSLASTTTSGYAYRLINAGEIQNQGVEIALNARALQIKDFAWDLGVNFSKNTSGWSYRTGTRGRDCQMYRNERRWWLYLFYFRIWAQ